MNYTDRGPPPVGEVSVNFCGWRGVTWSAQRVPTAVNLCFLDLEPLLFFIQVAPQLTSRGWVDPVPDPLLLRKSGSAGDRTRDLCICSQKLWPLDHRGFSTQVFSNSFYGGRSTTTTRCDRHNYWKICPTTKMKKLHNFNTLCTDVSTIMYCT